MITCRKCGIDKDDAEFSEYHNGAKGGKRRTCKKCNYKYVKKTPVPKDGYKFCGRCKEQKPLDAFGNNKKNKNGKEHPCRNCRSKEPQNKIRKAEWYQKDKQSNPEKYRKFSKIQNNKRKDYKTQWLENNREKINKRTLELIQLNKWRFVWRALLHRTLQSQGIKKKGRTISLLGYDYHALKLHLESLWVAGMSWSNHGEWHIDHIIPLILFPKDTPAYIVNCLPNLRPVWKEENLSRSKDGGYDYEKFGEPTLESLSAFFNVQ